MAQSRSGEDRDDLRSSEADCERHSDLQGVSKHRVLGILPGLGGGLLLHARGEDVACVVLLTVHEDKDGKYLV